MFLVCDITFSLRVKQMATTRPAPKDLVEARLKSFEDRIEESIRDWDMQPPELKIAEDDRIHRASVHADADRLLQARGIKLNSDIRYIGQAMPTER